MDNFCGLADHGYPVTTTSATKASMLATPHALLLDFGGVIADAPSHQGVPLTLAHRLSDLVDGLVPPQQINDDLIRGAQKYAQWRNKVSEQERPAELTHSDVWRMFVTRTWPEQAQQVVLHEATPLSYEWMNRSEWEVRPGIPAALDTAIQAGIPLAIVSNTLCGAAHRDFLTEVNLADRFSIQLYSDEVGVRKPNPEFALRAAAELGVSISQCWFVGDSLVRDIDCARRAGVGTAILMRSPRTDRDPASPHITPDITIKDGNDLNDLLLQTIKKSS